MTEYNIAENLAHIRSSIENAGRAYIVSSEDIQLIAISKQQPDARIDAALEAGWRVFGENRIQEAQKRWNVHKENFSDLRLHLVGPLQTNKVREAVALFDVIHTLDREKLALALAEEMKKQNKNLPCFIQINTGEEPQKSGISPRDLEMFLEFCRTKTSLNITGLMCLPPQDEACELHFALLKKLADRFSLPHLSMGMSADYISAIALGATHIRLGSAVFGERLTN